MGGCGVDGTDDLCPVFGNKCLLNKAARRVTLEIHIVFDNRVLSLKYLGVGKKAAVKMGEQERNESEADINQRFTDDSLIFAVSLLIHLCLLWVYIIMHLSVFVHWISFSHPAYIFTLKYKK